MIIKTLTTEEMITDLICDEYANWSPQGARALAEYWEQLSDALGEDLQWDRVAMRCEFTEFTSWDELRSDYDLSDDELDQYVAATFETRDGDEGLIVQVF